MFAYIVKKVRQFYTNWLLPKIRGHPSVAIVAGAGAFLGGLVFLGGHIVTTGVVAGALLSAAFIVLLWKARCSDNTYTKRVYMYAMSYPLAVDVALTLIAFVGAPAGITAWVAAGTCGVLMSCFLYTEHELLTKEENNVHTPLLHVDDGDGCTSRQDSYYEDSWANCQHVG